MKLGVSGERGSFSEMAGRLYAEKINITPDLVFLIDMENVLAAVEAKTIDLGIFPVVNFKGGLVEMAFSAMGRHLFEMIDEIRLDIHHSLMALPGTKSSEIKQIVSHSQALIQCSDYLKNNYNQAKITPWEDTAKAAKDLVEGKLSPNSAVIAPAASSRIYGLDILAENIQDNKPNYTVFIVVKKL